MKNVKVRRKLLEHPFWEDSDPSARRLVDVSRPLPPGLNPFVDDGVVIKVASVPGKIPHSKWYMGREGIKHGIETGKITRGTTVVEATSGNTGDSMAKTCNALGVPFVAVMSSDVPLAKINAIRVLGRQTEIHLVSDSKETTVECARRLGRQPGWYNPDQYSRSWNWKAHYQYLAPQIWMQTKVSVLAVASGTMGTCIGFERFARHNGHDTFVLPVLCAEGEEVPGARTLSSVRKDIRQPWDTLFIRSDLEFGNRHAAFLLSFLSWPYLVPQLGPSFGLALTGALRFLCKHKRGRTLGQFRDPKTKQITVVVFGPDECRPYIDLYVGELKKHEMSATRLPFDLVSLVRNT